MVIEYKPSHKLSVYNPRAGLSQADSASMNLPEDVINRPTNTYEFRGEVRVSLGVAGWSSVNTNIRLHGREQLRPVFSMVS
jgi:hypothetical protein